MVEITVRYEGELRCRSTHGPSDVELVTDAPLDNHGRGASFSPTDLVATALGTCILTTMGIVAARHGWALGGARLRVKKHMRAEPRSIERLEVEIFLPGGFDERARTTLERTALTCPVHRTLGSNVEMPIRFHWEAGSPA